MTCVLPQPAFADMELTVYGQRFATDIEDQAHESADIDSVPGNASLVGQKQWSDQRAATPKDLTDYIPGVFAQPHDGAESSRLSIRGSGLANTFQGRGLLLLEDGIPINMADGEFEFPVIEPWLITRAEVFPGADSIQYGASTFGGAINFITPTGSSDTGINTRFETGSFGTTHELLSDGETWDDGDLYTALTGFTQDGFRQHNQQTTGRLNTNWGWQLDEHFINRIYVSHTHTAAEIPGAISLAQIKNDPEQANPNNVRGDYQRNLEITRIADRSALEYGSDRIDTTLFYTRRHLDNPVTTYEFQDNNDTGGLFRYTHNYGKSRWLAGFNSYYGNADETRDQNVNGLTGSHILDRQLYAMTNEAYSQIEQHVAAGLFAIGAFQLSYATRNIHQTFPSVATQNKEYAGYNPRIGLRYDLADGTQLFTNLSRSFEPPTWAELSGGNVPGFNDLKAQTATTAEIGARGKYFDTNWQIAYYHGWLRNEFVNYQFADGSTSTINAARTKRDGIELGLNGQPVKNFILDHDALSLRTAYTYSHFTLDHDPLYGNNILPGVPEHYIRAELLYVLPSGIAFGPNVEWSPSPSPVDLTNSLSTDAYAIYGARAFWQTSDEKISLYVEARNLLDKHYAATNNVIPNANGNDGAYFYPGEGRAFYTGISLKL